MSTKYFVRPKKYFFLVTDDGVIGIGSSSRSRSSMLMLLMMMRVRMVYDDDTRHQR